MRTRCRFAHRVLVSRVFFFLLLPSLLLCGSRFLLASFLSFFFLQHLPARFSKCVCSAVVVVAATRAAGSAGVKR